MRKFLEKLMIIFPFTLFPFGKVQPAVPKSIVFVNVSFVKTVVIVAHRGNILIMGPLVLVVKLC